MRLLFIKKAMQKIVAVATIFYGTVIFNVVFAVSTTDCTDVAGKGGLSGMACGLVESFQYIERLVTGGSLIAGLGFAVAAIFKFKAHKDNPTQIPVGTPIAMLFIAVLLLFMVYFFKQLGVTIFGASASMGSWGGATSL